VGRGARQRLNRDGVGPLSYAFVVAMVFAAIRSAAEDRRVSLDEILAAGA